MTSSGPCSSRRSTSRRAARTIWRLSCSGSRSRGLRLLDSQQVAQHRGDRLGDPAPRRPANSGPAPASRAPPRANRPARLRSLRGTARRTRRRAARRAKSSVARRTAMPARRPSASRRARNSATAATCRCRLRRPGSTTCARPVAHAPEGGQQIGRVPRWRPTSGRGEPQRHQPTGRLRLGERARQPMHDHRLGLAAQAPRAPAGSKAKRCAGERLGRCRDQDGARRRRAQQARGRVHRVARHVVGGARAGAQVAGDDRPGMDGDVQADRLAEARRPRSLSPRRARSMSRAASSARSGSSSWATGAPNSASTASPRYLATNPP